MRPRTPRMYEPIWKELKDKASGHCAVLDVLPQHVSRVKRAIIKEKYKDQGTAFLNIEEGERLYLEFVYNRAARQLTVKLKQRVGIEEIRI